MSPIPSPCIKQCKLDAAQICIGCRRSLDEIRIWSQASETTKQQIWQRLLALPMQVSQKRCQQCDKTFSCGSGGQNGCWCMDLPSVLSPGTATADCYCPECLSSIIAKNTCTLAKRDSSVV